MKITSLVLIFLFLFS